MLKFDGSYINETPQEEQIANALLIAAAPCLLEALEDILEYIEPHLNPQLGDKDAMNSIASNAYKSIAKAKGVE